MAAGVRSPAAGRRSKVAGGRSTAAGGRSTAAGGRPRVARGKSTASMEINRAEGGSRWLEESGPRRLEGGPGRLEGGRRRLEGGPRGTKFQLRDRQGPSKQGNIKIKWPKFVNFFSSNFGKVWGTTAKIQWLKSVGFQILGRGRCPYCAPLRKTSYCSKTRRDRDLLFFRKLSPIIYLYFEITINTFSNFSCLMWWFFEKVAKGAIAEHVR